MARNVYTVKQVNAYIKNMFTQDFMLNRIYVKGEVSNCKYHTSGHIYFSLKDESGTIACVMFAGQRGGLSFHMREGQQIIVFGSVNVYERTGAYQLYANEIRLDGEGALYEKYQMLKQELEEMGMFAPEYKQQIPAYAKRIGVVTAPTGAAVRDIMNISARRNPYVQLILYPAQVQGEGAKESIVRGIRMLEMKEVDVIIIGRGGGSIEDLWAFNEEEVARAIFDCTVPVISAVGHETDVTIAITWRLTCSDTFGGCGACSVGLQTGGELFGRMPSAHESECSRSRPYEPAAAERDGDQTFLSASAS